MMMSSIILLLKIYYVGKKGGRFLGHFLSPFISSIILNTTSIFDHCTGVLRAAETIHNPLGIASCYDHRILNIFFIAAPWLIKSKLFN